MKNILSKSLIAVIIIVGGFAIFNFGFQYGYNQIPEAPSNLPPDADITILWDVWDKIETKYADSVDYQKMIYGAAKGLVASLGDPYSVFMEPEDSEIFKDDISGAFEGVGMEISIKDGQLTVVASALIILTLPFGRSQRYRKLVVIPGSVVIAGIGLWWAIERIFL
jgi:carboxyl-terminal processing protease